MRRWRQLSEIVDDLIAEEGRGAALLAPSQILALALSYRELARAAVDDSKALVQLPYDYAASLVAERDAAREQARAYEEAIRTATTDLRFDEEDIPRIVIHDQLAAVYRAALPDRPEQPDSVKTDS